MKRILKKMAIVVSATVGVSVLMFAALCAYLEILDCDEQLRDFYENQ